ncbi:hypothetical protein [Marinobacter sp.]|uniref:hypothetical protein n=1 Tax=Marinobacter sp. TaxID=50741 RepID=UPI00384E88FE
MSIESVKTLLEKDPEMFQTPCFVYVPELVERNYQSLREAIGTDLIISVKANHCIDLLTLISSGKDGFEAASESELSILTMAKGHYSFVNSPGLTAAMVRKAVGAKAQLVVDHPEQVALLAPYRERLKPVMLRVHPSALLELEPRQKVGHFGMDWQGLCSAIDALRELEIPVAGLHCFQGSYSFQKRAIATVSAMEGLAQRVEERLGYALTILNLGGGFGPSWQTEDFDFEGYRERLIPMQARYQLLHEAGRAIFATAGCFLTRVVSVKTLGQQRYAVCDGGIAQNFLLAQTESPFSRPFSPQFWPTSGDKKQQDIRTTLVGSSCNKDDVIGQVDGQAALPAIGDIALYPMCGAYNRTYSPVDFLGLAKAREYIVHEA